MKVWNFNCDEERVGFALFWIFRDWESSSILQIGLWFLVYAKWTFGSKDAGNHARYCTTILMMLNCSEKKNNEIYAIAD